MRALTARVFSETATHKNNPTGAALATVASGIACAPLDALSQVAAQAYPIEKYFLMRQTFTEYSAFQPGDLLVADGVSYAVRAVHRYDGQGKQPAYYHLVLEESRVS